MSKKGQVYKKRVHKADRIMNPWKRNSEHKSKHWRVSADLKNKRKQRALAKKSPELLLYPAKRKLTPAYKKQIDKGKPIYRLSSTRETDGYTVISIGPWKAVADDLRGYPTALLVTVKAWKYDKDYKLVPYELTNRQWRGLYSRSSLSAIPLF